MLYSQPVNLDAVGKTISVMFREWTQGDKELRSLYNITGVLPTFLNPTLKGYFQALQERDHLIAQMEQALEQWDVWLCPVAMTTAFTHRPKGAAVEVDGKKVPYFMASGAYTMPFSLTGHPVVVIPIGQTRDGLPIGMQIVGKRWREMELLAIAQEINKVVGGFQHPSGY
jgi:amidase